MNEITESLNMIEANLRKLGNQYKSGQHALIVDSLDRLTELRHLLNQSSERLYRCPECGDRILKPGSEHCYNPYCPSRC